MTDLVFATYDLDSGLAASRPGAPVPAGGRLYVYMATDTNTISVWDGAAWASFKGANTGDQTITLTGDVTGSGTGSFAATIAAGAVTLAKQANVATSSVFYRKTAGSGAPEVNTLATLKTDLLLTGTNSGDQTITLTGGVTGSGTGSFAATVVTNANLTGDVTSIGNTTTIANDAVTYAKMQNVTDARLLGRSAGSSGDTQEITVGTGLSLAAGALTSIITQYTDELAQDAIGAMVDGTLIYTDATPLLSRAALTGNVTAPTGSNVTTIAASVVTEAMQVLANNTTQNVTSTKHGYAPISPADATQFLNGAATPAFTRVSAIKGTTTNDNAAAGDVGELFESEILIAGKVTLTSASESDITTLSLTAGDWDAFGTVWFSLDGGITATTARGWISLTSATQPTPPNKGMFQQFVMPFTAGAAQGISAGFGRLSLAGSTTVYLSTRNSFTGVGNMYAYGYLAARRVR